MLIPVCESAPESLSLPPNDDAKTEAGVRPAWVALALQREADVTSGKVALVPGHEAIARIWARIA